MLPKAVMRMIGTSGQVSANCRHRSMPRRMSSTRSPLASGAVEIVFQDAEYAYIESGLEADDLVVTTSLVTVEEGVPLRTEDTTTAP